MKKTLSILVIILAVISMIVGSVFAYMGFTKQNDVKAGLAVEKVAYNFTDDKTAAPTPVESMTDLENMAKTLKSHRDKIAPSYGELTGRNESKKFDPTNPGNLSYAQGMNLENSLHIALLSFGMTWMMIGVGAFMWLVGIALLLIGMALAKS
jgi:hypothetical protein